MTFTKRLLLCLLAFSLTVCAVGYAEETEAKQSAATIISKLFDASPDQRYIVAHQLAEYTPQEIENALSFVPATAQPDQLVAFLSVLVPKGVFKPFEEYFKKVMGSNDSDAKLALLDLLSYAVPVEQMQVVFSVLSRTADNNLSGIESLRLTRTLWMIVTFMPGAATFLERNDFALPKQIQLPIRAALHPKNPENIRCEAAIILGEMGVDEPEVMELIKRVANDPTSLGARARSVMLGHPIFDEVVRRSQIFHVDSTKLNSWRLAMEACKGLATSLDRHSSFFDPDGVKAWEEGRSGEYGGIGAYVSVRDNTYIISRPFYNGPAYKAGLRSGDRIVEVEGEIMVGSDLDDLVRRLKGVPGTDVRIKIYRKGWTRARDYTLKRAKIDVPNIHTSKLPGNLAYIRLDSFSEKATKQMLDAIRTVKEWKPDGLVFDLRNNGGGGLQSAIEIVSMFIENNKLVVYEEGRPEFWPRQNHFSKNLPKFEQPVVLLVNEYSASASEIVSGALRDYGRATLVGNKTYGKGSVQIVFWVANSNFKCQFKITIASYFLPKGECIHEKGIEPHIAVDPIEVQGWAFDEMAKLRESGVLTAYIEKLLADKKLAVSLAENDYGDPSRYPGFDEWRKSIETVLDRETLRYVVSDELRRIIQDERGEEFACNPGSDNQLQSAILAVLRAAGKEPEKMSEVIPFVELDRARKAAEEAMKAKNDAIIGK